MMATNYSCPFMDKPTVNATEPGFFQQVSYYLNGPLSAIVIGQGLTTNIFSLAAFFSHINPKPSIYYYLIALCIWDIALLIFAALLYTVPIMLFGGQLKSSGYIPTYVYWYYLCGVTLVGTVWTVSILTFDRYLALCNPFKHMRLNRPKIRRFLIAVLIFSLVYSSPRCFEMEVTDCYGPDGSLRNSISLTPLKNNHHYLLFYKILGGLIFYSLMPYLFLLGLTFRISYQLRRTPYIQSTALLSTKSRIDSSNRILMAIIVKFLICHLLTTILDIWEALSTKDHFLVDPFVSCMVDISNFLVTLNSGTNFWIYLQSSKFFRRGCKRVLTCHCGQERYTLKAAGIHLNLLVDNQAIVVESIMSTMKRGTEDISEDSASQFSPLLKKKQSVVIWEESEDFTSDVPEAEYICMIANV